MTQCKIIEEKYHVIIINSHQIHTPIREQTRNGKWLCCITSQEYVKIHIINKFECPYVPLDCVNMINHQKGEKIHIIS